MRVGRLETERCWRYFYRFLDGLPTACRQQLNFGVGKYATQSLQVFGDRVNLVLSHQRVKLVWQIVLCAIFGGENHSSSLALAFRCLSYRLHP